MITPTRFQALIFTNPTSRNLSKFSVAVREDLDIQKEMGKCQGSLDVPFGVRMSYSYNLLIHAE